MLSKEVENKWLYLWINFDISLKIRLIKIDAPTFMPDICLLKEIQSCVTQKSQILGFKEFISVMLMRSLLKNIYKKFNASKSDNYFSK